MPGSHHITFPRITLGRMQNPVRGMLHGLAAAASLVGLVVVASRHLSRGSVVAAAIVYATSLVAMYTISSLYHSVPWSEVWKQRMRRLDHSAIFLVVAGTFTPIAVVALDGWWEWASLTVVWTAAVVGIVLKFAVRRVGLGTSVTIQNLMGWAAVVPMFEIARRLGGGTVAWIVVGGALYTVGMVFLLTKWPRMFPRIFSHHELFHVFVVAASSVHFYAIVTRVLPAAG